MSAVIMMTLFLAFKGVFIGTLILILNLTFFAIKFGSYLKADHHQYGASSHGWHPPIINSHGWPSQKDVHLHIHNAHGKPDLAIPYSTLNSATNGGWDVHSNQVEAWNGNSPYVHSGRQFSNDDFVPYQNIQRSSTDKSNVAKPRTIEKRSDNAPTIVMAEQKHIVTPYNYINKQNRK